MTATPPDPLATQHDTTDPRDAEPEDAQTQQLREENRALRELLAAQVQASLPRPSLAKRLAWWLISAPGAALVGWRSLLGREDAEPMTGKRVGYATLTVLYTLAIYGALVLLVVSWSTPNAARSGVNAAGPVRVPLQSPPAPGADAAPKPSDPAETREPAPVAGAVDDRLKTETPTETPTEPAAAPPTSAPTDTRDTEAPATTDTPAADAPAATPREPAAAPAAATAPKSTLRITEIPAENPHAWVDNLKAELARCATLGFFERPDCAWAARKQFCGANQGWGAIKECPIQQ
ncbi:hypothetical protein LMG3458_05528 [Achromobacter deleyi]|uniref:Uncharacterized protein n=1 Tax=Achromobacter deleyi TaxID=1353891 RepID=A0A6S7AVW0_9BURK|nr:hypothetical protein [Achromobacter deleyi]CAB3738552.1 hypothetical protein LMG3458_05528 [Achromobacter deleyi]CAB3901523.1 hypothetical protein LMG3482_04328 [Achromobacter deleyi]CAB3906903.1 hypothetical protein LMG3481_04566 [Achromobacter deleyi]